MPISVRTRFEVFKRDKFQCRYCGAMSPRVVLEVDHVVPVSDGGTDDIINLVASCWECNRGKADKPLSSVIDGEDPHERSIALLERERQFREYNEVQRTVRERVEREIEILLDLWPHVISGRELAGLRSALEKHPVEMVHRAMVAALQADKTSGLAYVHACLNRWSAAA